MKNLINIFILFSLSILLTNCCITSKQQSKEKCSCKRFIKNIQDNWVYDEISKKSYIKNYTYDSYVGLDSMNKYLGYNTNSCLLGKTKEDILKLFSIPLDKRGMHLVLGDKDCFSCLINNVNCNEKILFSQCSTRKVYIRFRGEGEVIRKVQSSYNINGISVDFILEP